MIGFSITTGVDGMLGALGWLARGAGLELAFRRSGGSLGAAGRGSLSAVLTFPGGKDRLEPIDDGQRSAV